MTSNNLIITKHAYEQAEARFNWTGKDLLDMTIKAMSNGIKDGNGNIQWDRFKFCFEANVLTTVSSKLNYKPIQNGPLTVEEHKLQKGFNTIAISGNAKILNVQESHGEIALYIQDRPARVKLMRGISVISNGQEVPAGGLYLNTVVLDCAYHIYDLDFLKINLQYVSRNLQCTHFGK